MTYFCQEKSMHGINRAGFGNIGFYDQKTRVAPSSVDVNLQYISRGISINHDSPIPNVSFAFATPTILWISFISASVVPNETVLPLASVVASLITGLTYLFNVNPSFIFLISNQVKLTGMHSSGTQRFLRRMT